MLSGRTILTVLMGPCATFLGERSRVACLYSCLTCSRLPGGFSKAPFSPMSSIEHGPPSRRTPWGISCAFSWTYAFLSSLSAGHPLRYCGLVPASRNRADCGASLMATEYGYKEFDVPHVRSLNVLLGPDDE